MKDVRLQRFAYTPHGTFGRLSVGSLEWFTVERPWLSNKASVSCIPEGIYNLRQRESGVVKRSTGGTHTRGWEVTHVPARTFIMLHPGNTMDDLEGCIAPGKALTAISGKWAVGLSRLAFDELMIAMAGRDEWTLTIDQLTLGNAGRAGN